MSKVVLHAILIFLIIVILFPTVWVITTSFRRDEAAFSSELFSSRLTLQNYIDLVLPERNMPVLVQELQNIISRAKPFDQLTFERAQKKTEESLKRLEQYLQQTISKHKVTKETYQEIDDFLKKNSETTKELVLKNLEELKKVSLNELKNGPQNKDQYEIVLYEYLSKERFDSTIFKIFKEDLETHVGFSVNSVQDYDSALEKLKQAYDLYIGDYLQKLNEISSKLNHLNKTSEELRKQISPIQDQVMKTDLILKNDLLPELNTISDSLQNLKNLKDDIKDSAMKTNLPLDDSSVLQSIPISMEQLGRIEQKLNILSDYADLKIPIQKIKDIMKNFTDIDDLDRVKIAYLDFIKSYREIQPKLEKILNEVEMTLSDIEDKAITLHNANQELTQIKAQIDSLERQKLAVQEKVNTLENQILDARRIGQLKLFSYELNNRITSVKAITSFGKTDLLKYSSLMTWLRNFMNSYQRKDEISAKLRKTIDDLKWIEEYRTFSTRFENTSKNLEEVLKATRDLLDDFEKTWRNLLSVSYSGVFVTSEHLSKLDDIVRSEFVSKVRADLAVVMRKAGVLMNITPFSNLKDSFRRIDKEFYRIDQIWKQKTKHYFLRWVLNSVVISLIVALITTGVCATAAYPFSRMRFTGRKYGIMSFLLIQMFPGVIFMVAIYNLLNFLGRYITFLGVDTPGGLIFAYLTNIAYNMYLIKGFYDLIPSSLEEAAIVDGATRFQSFYKIVLPLARPILTVVFLLVFIGTFNEYVVARIILQNVQNYTYALGLQAFAVGPYETEWGLFTAAALLGMLPMVILFLSLQRYLVSGLTRGAVKE
ncbi:ABC transporter permease subunit [Thermotoga profunda]|uniref:ABC transporter permease subunit n=1 Tax=Thermotoga profunda TaxID=1508420 RepID=UPI000597BE21|nr:ABC transporter permease subunit [Thermotoga profunda]